MKRKYLGLFFIILTAAYIPIATAGKCDKDNCCDLIDEYKSSCACINGKDGYRTHYKNYGSKSCKRKNGVYSTCGMAVNCPKGDTCHC